MTSGSLAWRNLGTRSHNPPGIRGDRGSQPFPRVGASKNGAAVLLHRRGANFQCVLICMARALLKPNSLAADL
jgi:hypothetical protein